MQPFQGVSLLGSLGKRDALRMLCKLQKNLTIRSRPKPAPPWQGAPYLKAVMYS